MRIFLTLLVLTMTTVAHAQMKTTYQNTSYILGVQKINTSSKVLTSDMAVLKTKIVAMIFIKKADVAKIHTTLGPNFATHIVPDIVKSEVGTVFSGYSAKEVVSSKRSEIRQILIQKVKKRLMEYQIQLKDLYISSIALPGSMEAAMLDKMVALEKRETQKHEYERAKAKLAHQKEAMEYQAQINAIISNGLDEKILLLKYIEVLEKLALSPESKVVVFGNGEVALPAVSPLKFKTKKSKKK